MTIAEVVVFWVERPMICLPLGFFGLVQYVNVIICFVLLFGIGFCDFADPPLLCFSDGETFISADDLRINLWNLEISNQSFNIVDVKPANMEDLTGKMPKYFFL